MLQEQQIAAMIENHRPARVRFLRVGYARNCPRRQIGRQGLAVKFQIAHRPDDHGEQQVPRRVVCHEIAVVEEIRDDEVLVALQAGASAELLRDAHPIPDDDLRDRVDPESSGLQKAFDTDSVILLGEPLPEDAFIPSEVHAEAAIFPHNDPNEP